MRKLLLLSLMILPLITLGLAGCGDEDGAPPSVGVGGTGGKDDPGTGGRGGEDDPGSGGGGGDDRPCENTLSTCDECVTPEEDPYKACSPHTEGCVPFDNAARIPGYPDVPVVP